MTNFWIGTWSTGSKCESYQQEHTIPSSRITCQNLTNLIIYLLTIEENNLMNSIKIITGALGRHQKN